MTTESKLCGRCGKEMTDGNGNSLQGMSIQVSPGIEGFGAEFLKQQLGKYELDTDYAICFECLIDNMLGGSL